MATVKCADCGFLALRHTRDRYLAEVEAEIRQTGDIPHYRGITERFYEGYPLCFAMAFDLRREMGELPSGNDERKKRFLGVIERERKCGKFEEWQQGFTPKEHQEMLIQERLLEMQRENQQRLQEQQRNWALEDRRWRLWQWLIGLVAGFAISMVASGQWKLW